MHAQIAYLTDMKRLLTFLDGIGSVGALLAAIAAPCCFPLFAGAMAAVGLGALGKFEGFALYALQGFALLSLFGFALDVRQHRRPWPFVLGVTSVVALVDRTNSGECVCERSRERYRRLGNGCGSREPVCASDVKTDRYWNRLGTQASTHGHKPERCNEFAKKLSATSAGML
jgi:hypothetical protein